MKCDQSEDFDNDEMVFWCPDSLSDSFSSCPVYVQLKEQPTSDVEKQSPYYGETISIFYSVKMTEKKQHGYYIKT